MTWTDWLFVAIVSPSYAFLLCWLIMSDSKAEDIKKLFRFITPKKKRN